MKRFTQTVTALGCSLILAAFAVRADDEQKPEELKPIQPEQVNLGRPVDFERDVYPFLSANCVACHSSALPESKLSVETAEEILKGGKRGPSVVAKEPDKSLLYQLASHGKGPAMPPPENDVEAEPLTPKELGILRQWILEGAAGGMGSAARTVNWQPLPEGMNAIYSLALSPWGELAAVGRANRIAIYDIPGKRQIAQLSDPALMEIQQDGQPMYGPGTAHRDFVHALAFNHDGTILASGGYRVVKLWQRPANVRTANFAAPENVADVDVSADGRWIAVAAGNNVTIYNSADGQPVRTLEGHSAAVTGIEFWPTAVAKHRVDQAVVDADAAVQSALYGLKAAEEALVVFDPRREKLNDEQAAQRKQQLEAAVEAARKAIETAVSGAKSAADAQAAFDKQAAEESRLFTGSQDKTVRVWKVADGSTIAQIDTPAEINDLTVSGDATKVVSAEADNVLRIWPVPTDGNKPEMPAAEMKGHGGKITSVALIPEPGSQVVSGSEDATVRIWDLNNGNQIRAMNHGGPVTGVAARPDGQLVASSGANNVGKLWQVNNGQQRAELKGDLAIQRKIAELSDEQTVAGQQVALAKAAFDAAEKNSKERDEALKKAQEEKTNADKAVPPAEEKAKKADEALAAAKAELEKKPDDDGLKKKVADAEKAANTEKENLKKATDAQAAAEKTVQRADEAVKKAKEQLEQDKKTHEESVAYQEKMKAELAEAQKLAGTADKPLHAVVFSPDGKRLATSGDDQQVHLWDGETGQQIETLAGQAAAVLALSFGTDNRLISAAADKQVSVWDANAEWKLIGQLGPTGDDPMDTSTSKFIDRVVALDFSRDGKLLATGGGEPSRSGELMVWDVEKRELVREFEDAHSDTVFGVEFSRDGKLLLSGSADKFAKTHDVETGAHVRSFEGHTHHVMDVSWKADGATFASAGADNAIKVWNVETGEQRRTITQNIGKQVTSLRFVGTGDDVVASCGDRQVRFFRTSNGQRLRDFGGGADFMYSADSTRDATLVVGGGEDGVFRIWNGTNGQAIATFDPPKPRLPVDGENVQASAAGAQ